MNAQLKMKAVVAAVALGFGAVASASPLVGEDLFFTAWNGNADAPSSIVIKLNETGSSFLSNETGARTLSGSSLTTLTNWLSSLGSTDGVRWNVSGSLNGAAPTPAYGVLTTSTNVTSADPGNWGQFTGLDAAVNNVQIFQNEVNPNLASTDAYFATNANQLFAVQFNGAISNINTFGAIGDSLKFYQMFADQDGNEFFEGDYRTIAGGSGQWRLNFESGVASLTYSAVPLPAAVWLLGSGLLGLLGISRRKSA